MMMFAALAACSASRLKTVKLTNGRVGYVIANCRGTAACDARSAAACGGSPYGIHERHTELRQEAQPGATQVMGVLPTTVVTYFKYVVECNPTATIVTHDVDANDSFTRAENELLQSFLKAQTTSDAIVRRSQIDTVCRLGLWSNGAEEILLATTELGDFTCPQALEP
jgi:hypothetical protein